MVVSELIVELGFYKTTGDTVSFQITPTQNPSKSKWSPFPFSKGGVERSQNSIRVPKEGGKSLIRNRGINLKYKQGKHYLDLDHDTPLELVGPASLWMIRRVFKQLKYQK